MSRCPLAEWRPVSNYTPGRQVPVNGLTLHHSVGGLDAAEARFNNRASSASAHFGIHIDGTIIQWVDTGDVAWHATDANWHGRIGVENESSADPDHLWEPLTPQQVASCAQLLQWLNQEHGVPIQVTDSQTEGGLDYHSLWSPTGCPGDSIIAQRAQIVGMALGVVAQGDPLSNESLVHMIGFQVSDGRLVIFCGGQFWYCTTDEWVKVMLDDSNKRIVPQMNVSADRYQAFESAIVAQRKQAPAASVNVDVAALAKAIFDEQARRLAA